MHKAQERLYKKKEKGREKADIRHNTDERVNTEKQKKLKNWENYLQFYNIKSEMWKGYFLEKKYRPTKLTYEKIKTRYSETTEKAIYKFTVIKSYQEYMVLKIDST